MTRRSCIYSGRGFGKTNEHFMLCVPDRDSYLADETYFRQVERVVVLLVGFTKRGLLKTSRNPLHLSSRPKAGRVSPDVCTQGADTRKQVAFLTCDRMRSKKKRRGAMCDLKPGTNVTSTVSTTVYSVRALHHLATGVEPLRKGCK